MNNIVYLVLFLIYWDIAIGWSLFLAYHAPRIHDLVKNTKNVIETYQEKGKTYQKTYTESQPLSYEEMPKEKKYQQIVLNFIGGFVGFVIIFCYASRIIEFSIRWETIIVFVITYWSVTGNLPYMLVQRVPWSK